MSSPNPDRLAFLTRVRHVRRQAFGEQGIPRVAEALGIPVRTWENFEAGVTIPGPVILAFLALTGVDPLWLLKGEGDPYASRVTGRNASI
jgi:hypothetical protein